jgi:hypothetical protein
VTQRPVVLSLVLVALAASVAAADPLPGSLHESTSRIAVPAGVQRVVVDLDAGDVTLRAGAPSGSVHKEWNLQEPRLTATTSHGTLRVVGRCDEDRLPLPGGGYVATVGFCRVDVALTVPAGVSVDLVADDVSVTGTRGATRVRAAGGASLTHLGPGAVDAVSEAGSLALRASNPSSTVVRSSSTLTLSDVRTHALRATSDAAGASLSDVRATALRLTASSATTLTRVSATSLQATSEAGGATLTDVTTHGHLSVRASSAAALSHVRAASLAATSDASSVEITDSEFQGPLVATGSSRVSTDHVRAATATLTSQAGSVSVRSTRLVGRLVVGASSAVSVDGLQAAGADLTSSAGSLDVRRSPLADLRAEASSSIDVDLPTVPRYVGLDSEAGSLRLHVPRSSYAVITRSEAGQVTVRDIVIDDRAPRTLDLRASGDIDVD